MVKLVYSVYSCTALLGSTGTVFDEIVNHLSHGQQRFFLVPLANQLQTDWHTIVELRIIHGLDQLILLVDRDEILPLMVFVLVDERHGENGGGCICEDHKC